jgi:hypothetical protein
MSGRFVVHQLAVSAAWWLGSFTWGLAQPPGSPPPLFVVDGLRFPRGTQESFFEPGEILTASVYKDAAAMRRRYGAAAADGVLELTLSTPFLLGKQLLRTPQDKARALRQLPARRVQTVRRLSAEESKAYAGSPGQTALVITLAE